MELNIKTNYSIGDKVWRMNNNKIHQDQVVEIFIRINNLKQQDVSYQLLSGGPWFKEETFYPSREALIDSL